MPELETWEWVLLGAAVYFALTALMRLMRRRRDTILNELRLQAEAEAERRRKLAEAERRNGRKGIEKSNRKAS